MGKLNYNIVDRRPLTVKRIPGENSGHLAGPTSFGAIMQSDLEMDQVDIEWTHEDGFPPDTIQHPIKARDAQVLIKALLEKAVQDEIISEDQAESLNEIFPEVMPFHDNMPHIGLVTVVVGEREIIKDQINVVRGTSLQGLNMILEEKRQMLAKSLGVEI